MCGQPDEGCIAVRVWRIRVRKHQSREQVKQPRVRQVAAGESWRKATQSDTVQAQMQRQALPIRRDARAGELVGRLVIGELEQGHHGCQQG